MIRVCSQQFLGIAQNALVNINPYANCERFLKTASLAAKVFPQEIHDSFYDFKQRGNQKGYHLIRGLPCDPNLMRTPQDLKEVPLKKETFLSEFWLASFGSLLGELFSYVQENDGNLFHNVRPDPSKKDKLCSESSSILLDLHSETAFHPLYPDYLTLKCLRGDPSNQAHTVVSSIRDALPDLSPELQKTLRQPLFRTGIDYSFGSQNGQKGNGPIVSILRGNPNDPLMIFDPDLMEGITEAAQRAITHLKAVLDTKKQHILLQEGDILFIDNHRAVHGRTPFPAKYDGFDRWLQRVYIIRDLQRAAILFNDGRRIVHHTI